MDRQFRSSGPPHFQRYNSHADVIFQNSAGPQLRNVMPSGSRAAITLYFAAEISSLVSVCARLWNVTRKRKLRMPGGYRTTPEKVEQGEGSGSPPTPDLAETLRGAQTSPVRGSPTRNPALPREISRNRRKDSANENKGECDEAVKIHLRKPSRLAQLVITLDFTAEPPEDREALAL